MSDFSPGVKEKYLPVIDGLRGIAVVGVLLYHLGVSWVPGGFLGVDIFFVISGYIITRTIIDHISLNGSLNLKKFYIARIRRLFPALIAMIVGSSLLILLVARDAASRFINDLPWALTGVNNWRLIYLHQDYFSHIGRPPLLQHTWSLSVEIQFYLLWPMILYFIWKRFGKKNISKIALVFAVFSGITLFTLSLTRGGTTSSSHIYFGSDTHSSGLFLGSALAVSWIPDNLSRNISARAILAIDAIAASGIIGILLCFFMIHEDNSAIYNCAFPISALLGTIAIACLVHPATRITTLLNHPVLLWLGERSYGIYLWHWVIFNVTRPNIDITGPLFSLNLVRILIVFAISDLSYRFVEIPIRKHQLSHWFAQLRYRIPRERKMGYTLFISSMTTLFFISAACLAVADTSYHQEILGANKNGAYTSFTGVGHNDSQLSMSDPLRNGIWLTGDSIILGIRQAIAQEYHLTVIDARVGRQIGELINVSEEDKALAPKSPVVVDLGNNNILTKGDIEKLLNIYKDQPWVVLVNTAVPRTYRESNDALISEVAATYPQVTVVDWNQISQGHPEYFSPDGVHLVSKGVTAYLGAINEAITALEKRYQQ
jgi:peptidoglycan/LPS O-acetylase OafA/YrhL